MEEHNNEHRIVINNRELRINNIENYNDSCRTCYHCCYWLCVIILMILIIIIIKMLNKDNINLVI